MIILLLIADPGQNYIDLSDLKSLAKKSAEAGFTHFKPQLFLTESLYDKNWKYYDFVKSHELSLQDAEDIYDYCEDVDITFDTVDVCKALTRKFAL